MGSEQRQQKLKHKMSANQPVFTVHALSSQERVQGLQETNFTPLAIQKPQEKLRWT